MGASPRTRTRAERRAAKAGERVQTEGQSVTEPIEHWGQAQRVQTFAKAMPECAVKVELPEDKRNDSEQVWTGLTSMLNLWTRYVIFAILSISFPSRKEISLWLKWR
jgi:hypothetical protein